MSCKARWLAAVLLLGGCATVPQPQVEGPIAQVTYDSARELAAVGSRVRWGGEILAVTPEGNRTCFEILSRPLDASGRPRRTDETDGRFLACARGFYDPAAYPAGRKLTVVGKIERPETRKLYGRDYLYPRLEVEKLYLWPRDYYSLPPLYDPFWGPWPYNGYPYWPYSPFYPWRYYGW